MSGCFANVQNQVKKKEEEEEEEEKVFAVFGQIPRFSFVF
jgi:hypothetical protein